MILKLIKKINNLTKEKKAQISIEALIILGFIIIILVSITYPMAFKASSTAQDVKYATLTRTVADKISHAINFVYYSGVGTEKTFYINAPASISVGTAKNGEPLYERYIVLTQNNNELRFTLHIIKRNNDGSIKLNETKTIIKELPPIDWIIYYNGENVENITFSGRYRVVISWNNISFYKIG